jgi:hypothetical protein
MKNVLFFCILGLMMSCGKDAVNNAPLSSNSQSAEVVIEYGNGVYYFDCTSSKFGKTLSNFISSHPELEVSALSGEGVSGYGEDRGYWVITRPKAQK